MGVFWVSLRSSFVLRGHLARISRGGREEWKEGGRKGEREQENCYLLTVLCSILAQLSSELTQSPMIANNKIPLPIAAVVIRVSFYKL